MSDPDTPTPDAPAFDEGDAFELFGRLTDRGPRWVDFDPSLPESLDPERHPSGLLLRVLVQEVGPDGQPTEHEARRQETLEQRLFELLQHHRIDGRLLARATGGGEREWLMVLAQEGLADYALRKLGRKFPEHEPSALVCDPVAVLEADFLPDALERLGIEVRHRLEALLEEGADLSRRATLRVPADPADGEGLAAAKAAGWRVHPDGVLTRSVVPDQGELPGLLAALADELARGAEALAHWELELG